ncbi:hypothetical protein AM256_17660 [Burkholderia pseudomallei]|nr:HAD domain-containing protein [Burkholderia pseudomallei]ALB95276.1 hypothetical protein AM256_17660 [Burkholderia pseudomallei]ALC01348.1 hypothetical protein AM257_17685 [Burkholderia pseudomallei]MBF3420856.1 helix-turn-helix domain-containing protein [Burkholderia pseudomallei]MBF3538353.1 helix-turn-helix domain-containing protein [Burkholderia pseudomallei]MBF3600665.1 helix-turn-helix domain-containing protein [Burkholderia pseudomallei]
MPSPSPLTAPTPLAIDLQELGQRVRSQRLMLGLSLVDAAYGVGVSTSVLARLENGNAIRTETLFKVLTGLGLALLVLPKDAAGIALTALGHTVNWHSVARSLSSTKERAPLCEFVPDRTTPTLFLDFDGTLHAGHALLDDSGRIVLDSGRPLFEFAPLLVEMLRPYPLVEIVLTTSWLQSLPTDKVIAHLPPELARRVVGTTKNIKSRLSYEQSGAARTDIIAGYAFGKRLKNWLAIDDSVFGAYKFGREPGELVHHFLLLDSTRGISDDSAQQRIQEWLIEVHR